MSWFTIADLGTLLPVIVLALGAFAVLLADPFSPKGQSRAALPYVALGAALTAAIAVAAAWGRPAPAVNGALALGPFAVFVALIALGATALAILSSIGYARALGFEIGEYYGLLLLAASGMVLLAAANDLITLFIAFELMSIAVYCLVAIRRGDARASEGAMKYFVLGAFSSGFLLYGLTLLYGATGTIYLDQMGGARGPLVVTALALLVIAFGFKVGAVPFHSWVPDAYQGAPAVVTGFMAVAVKAAAFGIFVRVLGGIRLFGSGDATAAHLLWTLAVATMVVGNAAALTQSNLKRLFAYSGIAHSGYVLVGLAAGVHRPEAIAGALFYLAGYGAMAIGAFAVLTTLRRDGRDIEDVADLGGLARERPAAALAMTVFMASFIGIPPTAGFMGKLWIFRAAVEADMTGLVVIALVTTALSIYYYLRIVAVMYTAEPTGAPARESTWAANFAVAAAAIATVLIGLFPSGTLEAATRALAALGR